MAKDAQPLCRLNGSVLFLSGLNQTDGKLRAGVLFVVNREMRKVSLRSNYRQDIDLSGDLDVNAVDSIVKL